MTTETRSFTGAGAFDGYAGFRMNRTYQLCYRQQAGRMIAIELDHVAPMEGKPAPRQVVVTEENFEKWWVEQAPA